MEFSRNRLPFPTPEGEISITSDNVEDTTPVAESEEELKSLLMKVKEESEKKTGLKLNIKKTKITGSSAITFMTATMKLKDTCSLEEKLWKTWTAH